MAFGLKNTRIMMLMVLVIAQFCFVCANFATGASSSSISSKNAVVILNGEYQDELIQVVIRNQTVYLPITEIDRWLKTKTISNGLNSYVTSFGTSIVKWKSGIKEISWKNTKYVLQFAPFKLNSKTFVPAIAFAKLFGAKIAWQNRVDDDGTISIQTQSALTAVTTISKHDFITKMGTKSIDLTSNLTEALDSISLNYTTTSKDLITVSSGNAGIVFHEFKYGKSTSPVLVTSVAEDMVSYNQIAAEWKCKVCSTSRGIKIGSNASSVLTKYGKPNEIVKMGVSKLFIYRAGKYNLTFVQGNSKIDKVTEIKWQTPLYDRLQLALDNANDPSGQLIWGEGDQPTPTSTPISKPQFYIVPSNLPLDTPAPIYTATPSPPPILWNTPTPIPTLTPIPSPTDSPEPTPTPVRTMKPQPTPVDYIKIYYQKSSSVAYMHYRIAGRNWTVAPGAVLTDSGTPGYVTVTVQLQGATGIAEAAFSDGNNNWDNNGGSGVNYSFAPGTWTVTNRQVTEGTPADRTMQLQGSAPNGPGVSGKWADGSKEFLGSSVTGMSQVIFTGVNGALSEVYYPSPDQAQSVTTRLLIGDSNHTWMDDETKQPHTVRALDRRSLAWEVVTTDSDKRYQLTKTFFTDPDRQTVIERVKFDALVGTVSDYDVYVVHDPALSNSGSSDTAMTALYNGKPNLVAKQNQVASAVAVSTGFDESMISNGYAGVNDGMSQLISTRRIAQMYDKALNGNVIQTGKINLLSSSSKQASFDLAIGFGTDVESAMDEANGSLENSLSKIQNAYVTGWKTYCSQLKNWNGAADDIYYLSAMTLKSSQDKKNGAIVAALGTPWGENIPDSGNFTYHLVWSRDLYKFATALATAGDTDSANKAVEYLFRVQMDSNTGRFPQNSRVDGTPEWSNTQMDEQAMPIMLAWQLKRTDLWSYIQKTADYLASNGPYTPQERWEETGGYSPSTLAAEIAGLVCASDLARQVGDSARAAKYLNLADQWQRNVDNWTFTSTGTLGNGKYYVRIDATGRPNEYKTLKLANDGGTVDSRSVVDMGFLELVRYGVKSATDYSIVESLQEVDQAIKQTINGKGDAWYRYTNDRYGEAINGQAWNFTPGKGRLWPFLTAERGMYEFARTKNTSTGMTYLNTLRSFADPNGFLPEQVWDNQAPNGKIPGTATGSVQPLNWTMGEYITLLASVSSGEVIGTPSIVKDRYAR